MKPAVIAFIVVIIFVVIIFIYLLVATSDESAPTDTSVKAEQSTQADPAPAPVAKAPAPVAKAPVTVAAPVVKTNCNGNNVNSYNLIGNRLKKNETIKTCGGLISNDKRNIVVQQSDGNFVLYNTYTGKSLWATNTVNGVDKNGKLPFRTVYQGDSNIVMYDTDNKVMWASNTETKPSDNLIMQEDGNLVLYTGEPINTGSSWSGSSPWATGTNY